VKGIDNRSISQVGRLQETETEVWSRWFDLKITLMVGKNQLEETEERAQINNGVSEKDIGFGSKEDMRSVGYLFSKTTLWFKPTRK